MPKKEPKVEGAPEWVVTYGDTMSLLLCFFILLVAMSEMKRDVKFIQVMSSLKQTFGGYQGAPGAVPIENTPFNVLIQKLLELEIPVQKKKVGDTDEEGIEGREFRVTNVRSGIEVVIGGRITFERFSAVLRPEGKELIAQVADRLRGYNTRILVRGHATREKLPQDSLYRDARDLSYARAKAVADELISHGIRDDRLVMIAVGDHEPLVKQAYTEERRALNRRVELIVTEDTIEDYAGDSLHPKTTESSHGGPE